MTKVLNIGSINIDYVYQMESFVKAGETLASSAMHTYLGGKGANQSVALAKAGLEIYHAGNIAAEDQWIIEQLNNWGVNTSLIKQVEGKTGHAIIQINHEGENAILLHGGANQSFTEEQIDEILSGFSAGDILLLQNEINLIPYIIKVASKRELKIMLNPAPMTAEVKQWPLNLIDYLIINESEGEGLTGFTIDQDIINSMLTDFPNVKLIYTKGAEGSIYADNEKQIVQSAYPTKVKDTTSAGDTFIGYFTAGLVDNKSIPECLALGARAASITVSKAGGAVSIPEMKELNTKIG